MSYRVVVEGTANQQAVYSGLRKGQNFVVVEQLLQLSLAFNINNLYSKPSVTKVPELPRLMDAVPFPAYYDWVRNLRSCRYYAS